MTICESIMLHFCIKAYCLTGTKSTIQLFTRKDFLVTLNTFSFYMYMTVSLANLFAWCVNFNAHLLLSTSLCKQLALLPFVLEI